jgi:EF-P beta-lysylation protein EpmB
MISTPPIPLEIDSWPQELARAIRSPQQLLHRLGLADHSIAAQCQNDADFPLRVPEYFVGLMRQGDPEDPLLAQVLSRGVETDSVAGFVADPVGDRDAIRSSGVLQKYDGRALLLLTGACAVHCRYCFRRHFPYSEQAARGDWTPIAAQIADLGVDEIILSGGDPLMLSDRRLRDLIDALAPLSSLRRLRVHTRLPVVLPNRVTDTLLSAFRPLAGRCVWVIHANHPHEVTAQLGAAVARFKAVGDTVLNQSVLLKSVNDDADSLETLSKTLFEHGVLPYYLHQLDPVAGAAHFEVPEDRARHLLDQLRRRLPGYLVPRLVREIAGRPYKQPIGSA